MGNLITDAMVWEWARNSTSTDGWTEVTMAMINAGGFHTLQDQGKKYLSFYTLLLHNLYDFKLALTSTRSLLSLLDARSIKTFA